MLRILFLFVLKFIILGNIFATHLVGGNLAYEFVGVQPNGDYRYKLKLNYYFDCGPNSSFPTSNIPDDMTVAIYAHDDPTDIYTTNPGNYVKYGANDIEMVYNSAVQEFFEIVPDNPSNCSVGITACIYLSLIHI